MDQNPLKNIYPEPTAGIASKAPAVPQSTVKSSGPHDDIVSQAAIDSRVGEEPKRLIQRSGVVQFRALMMLMGSVVIFPTGIFAWWMVLGIAYSSLHSALSGQFRLENIPGYGVPLAFFGWMAVGSTFFFILMFATLFARRKQTLHDVAAPTISPRISLRELHVTKKQGNSLPI